MAQIYQDQAAQQLAPLYDQQIQAQKAQIPAIQQLYSSLLQGLQGQQATENQNILESASQRGVLRSTLPVDAQTQLGASYLQQRGALGVQHTKDIAEAQGNIAKLQLSKVEGINSLADTLYQQEIKRKESEAALIAAQQKASYSGGGGGSRGAAAKTSSPAQIKQQAVAGIAKQFAGLTGRDGKVSNETWAAGLNDAIAAGFTPRQFWQTFGQYVNTKYKSSYAGYGQR